MDSESSLAPEDAEAFSTSKTGKEGNKLEVSLQIPL